MLLGLAPAVAAGDDLADVQATILARTALQQDPLLSPLNLGVRVRDGIAVLWGPVPSQELATRAAERLRALPQLRGVRNELFVDPWEDPPAVTVGPVRPPPPPPRNILTAKPPQPVQPASSKPAPEWIPVHQPAAKPPVKAEVPPVRLEVPKAPPPDPAADLLAAVRRLQAGEERYRRVTVAVEGATVYLGGIAYRWADIHELSRSVSRLPGVNHVILRGIRSEGR